MRPLAFEQEILHFHVCAGSGGGAKGFNRGQARVGLVSARPRCIGGVDVDPAGIADFDRVAGVRGAVLDLFTADQFAAFHGRVPPAGWREATPDDFRRAAHGERPHVVFMSTPCKGFSGLLSEKLSAGAKYQALNGLTLRAVWLTLEAWASDPPEFILFENVPRIATRGRRLLDQIEALLTAYGYVFAETVHDCGVLGGLGQSRKRFLLVARHAAKVPPFLYEPPRQRLRSVGEILDALPLPGAPVAGPMHRVPSLQWKTWVRLAFVEAGSDWRSLNRLRVNDGMLQDFAIAPDAGWHRGVLGVRRWDETAGTVTGRGSPTTGTFAVADPREACGDAGCALPAPGDRLVAVIRALDGTWHRPFTTFELAALQSYVGPEDVGFAMEGTSDSAWRERIGNMVPPDSAAAIMGVIARTLLLAKAGETFMLSSEPIWVRPVAVALAVDLPLLTGDGA